MAEYIKQIREPYVKVESYFTRMEDIFCIQFCKLCLYNSAAKIRALLGTSEFFLINATNADFIA